MVCSVLEGGRSANSHEFCFQAVKRSHMECFEGQGGLFPESQEWQFQAAKLSDTSSNIMQEGQFSDVHE